MKATGQCFIGLGAQKSGTTWLADYLKSHPDVSLSPIKEIHFFDSLWLDSCKRFDDYFLKKLKNDISARKLNEFSGNISENLRKSLALLVRSKMAQSEDFRYWYRTYFDTVCPGSSLFGEITPSYSMLDAQHFSKIDSIFSNTKYIFLMRDPVSRYWSQLRFFYKKINDESLYELFEDHLDDPKFVLRGDYKRTIENLRSVIPDNRIFFEFYENLFGIQGTEVIKRLTDFLEIGYVQPDFGKRVHESSRLELPQYLADKAMHSFQSIYDYIHDEFEGQVPKQWKM